MQATDDLALLTDAAHAAGDIARRYWNRSPTVWDKDNDAGPVTEADIAVNRMLLGELRGARPDYGWLSEESEDSVERLDAESVFIIDPIDGTRAFIAGDKGFSHSLAVARSGRITAAVVYLPIDDRLYVATEDGAAMLNGAVLTASAAAKLDGSTLLTSRGTLHPDNWPGGVPPVSHAFRSSIAYRLCLVAEGRFDAMMSLRPTWEWDIAAGDLIVRRAGAAVTDRTGAALRYNAEYPQAAGIVAAPESLHRGLLDRLRGQVS